MRIEQIKLTNWKNFKKVEITLPDRAFLIGPNASGKSNFLDAFRFLRDLAVPGGGLQQACRARGGISKIRNLSARNPSYIEIEVALTENADSAWGYRLRFTQEGKQQYANIAIVREEEITHNGAVILTYRPAAESSDPLFLSQTALEQISINRDFRPIVNYFSDIAYLHLVPQMIREAAGTFREQVIPDIYGGNLLEDMAKRTDRTRKRRLKKIEEVLKIAIPQLEELTLNKDDRGAPHLEARYRHWRPNNAGRQNESQFSDGTLRLIGLLWALQEGNGLILMEEPELSLHSGIVRKLAPFIHKMQVRGKDDPRQVLISTHSVELLSDESISAGELLMFNPGHEGTEISTGLDHEQIRRMMEAGYLASEVALPTTELPAFEQLALFDPE